MTFALPALVCLSACLNSDEVTEFPDGLTPLMEEIPQQTPPFSEGSYPETVLILKGEASNYDWAQGVGFVLADLETVYPALREADVMVDRRSVDRYSVMDDPAAQHEFGFIVHNEVDDIVDVQFDLTWRFGTIERDEEGNRTIVAATYQKTFGTSFIDSFEGSVVLQQEAEGVTRFTVVERIEATGGDPDRIESYIRDLFADLVEVSHGRPVVPL